MKLEKRINLTQLFDLYKNLLTQNQRQILHLYLIEDVSITEISKILVTSRQAIHDAIKKSSAKLIDINSQINSD